MTLLTIWFALVLASFLGTLADVLAHPNRRMPVMNSVWPLVALYFGPVGVGLYALLSGRASGAKRVHATPALPQMHAAHEAAAELSPSLTAPGIPSTHARHDTMSGMDEPLWMRSARSATHCMAGCALGDLLAMVAVQGLGWSPFGRGLTGEVLLGSVLAFLFGLFIFQALPIMAERRLGFAAALTVALQADLWTISAYLAGQIPTFYALAGSQAMGAGTAGMGGLGVMSPASLLAMQASMAVGFLTTYPINYWLVATGVKHGM